MTDTNDTDARLAAIREREQQATPGPWAASSRDASHRLDSNDWSGLGWEVHGPTEPQLRGQFARGEDAIFLAHAREDVPWLLGEVERLRAEIDRLQIAIRWATPFILDMAEPERYLTHPAPTLGDARWFHALAPASGPSAP